MFDKLTSTKLSIEQFVKYYRTWKRGYLELSFLSSVAMSSLNVSKDSKGFDDIDKFWSAAGES